MFTAGLGSTHRLVSAPAPAIVGSFGVQSTSSACSVLAGAAGIVAALVTPAIGAATSRAGSGGLPFASGVSASTAFVAAIIVASLLLQLLAAVFAIRLLKLTGRHSLWVFLTLAMAFMTMRRATALAQLIAEPHIVPSIVQECVALLISIFCVIGLRALRPVIDTLRDRELRALDHRARLAAAFDNLPFDVWICSGDGRLEYQNPVCLRSRGNLVGHSAVGPSPVAPTPRDSADRWQEANARAIAGECVNEEIGPGLGRHGRMIHRLIAPLRVEGEMRGAVGVELNTTAHRRSELVMRHLLGATASTGEAFFSALSRGLCDALGVRCALVGELPGDRTGVFQTLACCVNGQIVQPVEHLLSRSPCVTAVLGGHEAQFFRHGVRQQFAGDELLASAQAESFIGVPLHDSDGAAVGILCVIHDGPIDESLDPLIVVRLFGTRAAAELERLRSLRALAESERSLASLVSNLPGMVYRCLNTPEWPMDIVSDAARDLTGYPSEDIREGRVHFGNLIVEEDREGVWQEVQNALHERRRFKLTYRLRHADGSLRIAWEQGIGVYAPDGTLRFLEGFITDITEQRQAEEALRKMEEAAREAQQRLLELQKLETERVEVELAKARKQLVAQTRLATVGQVSASIAHELRNPLGAVRNAAYYLKQRFGAMDDTLREYLDIIDAEVAVSDRIISNLMDMTRGERLHRASVGLYDLMREVCGIVQLPRGVAVEFSAEARAKRVWAAPIQLRQVLTNLVTNSIQAMEGAGRIDVDARSGNQYDEIEIRDSGPGIALEHRSRLFEPLFTTKAKGTGLGLALCRLIIEQHDGELVCAEDAGSGAVFMIRLPRQPESAAQG